MNVNSRTTSTTTGYRITWGRVVGIVQPGFRASCEALVWSPWGPGPGRALRDQDHTRRETRTTHGGRPGPHTEGDQDHTRRETKITHRDKTRQGSLTKPKQRPHRPDSHLTWPRHRVVSYRLKYHHR
ncbi:hypothetical protein NHX12_033873 [Muraenolepis orangiensis]|uniref:Uncharacterized protein n=1 Tax=Muraenolepis orangiensis TaxID=630683 RepID=A0A9Q0IIC9_9TELE|nr:hypothetical protein NHX12_033873 [Muraenolepis orangiensis]